MYPKLSPRSAIQTKVAMAKWSTLNRELNKLIEFYKVLATVQDMITKVASHSMIGDLNKY
ncbi:hypothetical protein DP149_08635 [Clostridium tetani]|nr:hypothetical protein [Clostridium tetani]KGI37649.1 hypothetical protein KY52_08845 [Clostridium tetani]KGI45630.1 hypothetical protein KY54_05905 [Clostridium tetani]KHO31517.1 hypothetical protein OR63_09510 [Clostridium tetani]KIG20578.1 hypothetical protein RS78_08365 [Clostridium tetani]RXI44594.1 hypothetical protein DP126_10840 [Clostridium tetani]